MMIDFSNVSKTFRRTQGQQLLRSYITQWLRREKPAAPFYALKNVSFKLDKGESLAVIGPNGSGKSTLLGLVAGLSRPDRGKIVTKGRVAGLLELGSGFHPDLTGSENVRLNASLLGISRKKTGELFEEILDFAAIGDFIHEPLRTYSSGMVMRLAFAVAVTIDPEILLIDEVLAVGDQDFAVKCFEKIHSFRRAGKTLICVSHAQSTLQQLCDRAIWLNHGEVVMSGGIWKVTAAYAGHQAATV